jgi:hypothetical protein
MHGHLCRRAASPVWPVAVRHLCSGQRNSLAARPDRDPAAPAKTTRSATLVVRPLVQEDSFTSTQMRRSRAAGFRVRNTRQPIRGALRPASQQTRCEALRPRRCGALDVVGSRMVVVRSYGMHYDPDCMPIASANQQQQELGGVIHHSTLRHFG